MNFYNDNNPFAIAALKRLVEEGFLAPGVIDSRSITEIKSDELHEYTQCHFFCGEGGWPLALDMAGWPRSKRVWTGSAPCQPFSLGGARKGSADERHLWPAFFGHIKECQPPAVFGEQVEAAISLGWLDGVACDLEAENYAFASCVLRADCAGAPHRRKRLYWSASADSNSQGGEGLEPCGSIGEAGQWDWRGQEDLQSVAGSPFQRGDRWPQPLLRRMDDGLLRRMERLHLHGNAIVPALAARFIRASVEAIADLTQIGG